MARLKIGSFEADGRTVSLSEKRSAVTDSSDSYRDINGVLHENILGVRIVLDFTVDMLDDEQAAALKSELSGGSVTAAYSVPNTTEGVFSVNAVTTEFSCADSDGTRWRVRALLERTDSDGDFG